MKNIFSETAKTILISVIKLYRLILKPVLPSYCRHTPSCSQYAMDAIKIHGFFKGTWLGLKRVLKCHPLGTSGHDPVPEKNEKSAITIIKG